MKKSLLAIAFVVLPAVLIAQPYSNNDKMLITLRIDTLLQHFMQKSTLTEPGGNKQSTRIIKELKSLFEPAARVFDDINAEYADDGNGYPYKSSEKPRNLYFDGLIEQFPGGLQVTNKMVNINYENLDKGMVSVALSRTIAGIRSSGKYSLMNEDTLIIWIKIQANKTVKINAISSVGSNVRVLNDMDLDGVIDTQDECKDEKGKMTLKGCPDRDDDGIPDKVDDCPEQAGSASNKGCPASTFAYQFVFSASAGLMLNFNSVAQPTPADLPYDQEIMDRNNTYVVVKNPGLKFSKVNFAANIAYFYGKKKFSKNKGISIGFMFTNYDADYTISGSKMVFRAYDDKVANPEGYRRILTLDDFSEKTNFTILNFQLMYRIKGKLGSKWAWELGVGPSYNLIRTQTTLNQNKVYVEGYLQYDKDTYQPHYNTLVGPQVTDVPIIRDSIIGIRTQPDPQKLFANLYDRSSLYDYAKPNVNIPDRSVKYQTGISINANVDFYYHIRPKTAIKVGFVVVYAPDALNVGDKGAQVVSDKEQQTPDYYNTVFNSGAKKSYTAFGLNLGLLIGISTTKK